MVVSCSAYGCTNRRNPGANLQFFGFPLRKPDVLKRWVSAVRRKNFTPTKNSRLCAHHFVESDYLVRPGVNVRHLKEDAVPSVFPAFPEHYQPKPKRIRKSHVRITQEVEKAGPSSEAQGGSIPDDIDCESDNVPIRLSDEEVQTDDKSVLPHSTRVLQKKLKVLQQLVRKQKAEINTFQRLMKAMKSKGFVDEETGLSVNRTLKCNFRTRLRSKVPLVFVLD